MSFANKYLVNLRKMGRKVVLPSGQIKQVLRNEIDFCDIRNIVDFGAGTLYWSEYFANIAESSADSTNSAKTTTGGGRCNVWKYATICARFLPSTKFIAK